MHSLRTSIEDAEQLHGHRMVNLRRAFNQLMNESILRGGIGSFTPLESRGVRSPNTPVRMKDLRFGIEFETCVPTGWTDPLVERFFSATPDVTIQCSGGAHPVEYVFKRSGASTETQLNTFRFRELKHGKPLNNAIRILDKTAVGCGLQKESSRSERARIRRTLKQYKTPDADSLKKIKHLLDNPDIESVGDEFSTTALPTNIRDALRRMSGTELEEFKKGVYESFKKGMQELLMQDANYKELKAEKISSDSARFDPTIHERNSCGTHVHVSDDMEMPKGFLSTLHGLWVTEYQKKFLKNWYVYENRGFAEYATPNYVTTDDLKNEDGSIYNDIYNDRYKLLNFSIADSTARANLEDTQSMHIEFRGMGQILGKRWLRRHGPAASDDTVGKIQKYIRDIHKFWEAARKKHVEVQKYEDKYSNKSWFSDENSEKCLDYIESKYKIDRARIRTIEITCNVIPSGTQVGTRAENTDIRCSCKWNLPDGNFTMVLKDDISTSPLSISYDLIYSFPFYWYLCTNAFDNAIEKWKKTKNVDILIEVEGLGKFQVGTDGKLINV